VPTTEVKVSYPELRRVVIALHHYGVELKHPSLTFSHGNTGNEFLALADRFDRFVSDLEPRHTLTLLNDEAIEHRDNWRREQFKTLQDWQEFARELAAVLDCSAITDDILTAVKNLKLMSTKEPTKTKDKPGPFQEVQIDRETAIKILFTKTGKPRRKNAAADILKKALSPERYKSLVGG
jgi:hypothetical protein